MGGKHGVHGRVSRAVAGAVVATVALVAGSGTAYAEPTITGDAYVGGRITVSDTHSCDFVDTSLQILRPLGGNMFVLVVNGQGNFTFGQDVSVSVVLPATDFQGTPLEPGQTLVAELDGMCNASGDQFGVQFGEIEFVLGTPPTEPTTTTTTTAPAPTTTVAAAAPTTTPQTAAPAAAPTTAAAAQVVPQATLPRTGSSTTALVSAGAGALALGAALAGTARRTRSRAG